MPDGRTSHRRKLRGTEVLHTRFGVTDPKVFRTLATSAVGVEGVDSPSARYTSLAFVQQAGLGTYRYPAPQDTPGLAAAWRVSQS